MITIYDSFHSLIYQIEEVFCGTKGISFRGPKVWNIVPNEFKKETLNVFKKLIQKWQP